MGVEKSVGRDRAHDRNLPNFLKLTCGMPMSRASLLASASLVASVAFGAPDRALAKCSGADQTFSTATIGPVFSDGGALTTTTSGSITGASGVTGLDGVEAAKCSVTTLSNSGKIAGGAGDANLTNGFGGIGLSNSNKIGKLTNSGAIDGGDAFTNNLSGQGQAVAGTAVSNTGAIRIVTNTGAINGGEASSLYGRLAAGGDAILNSGRGSLIGTLINSGTITGGAGNGQLATSNLAGAGVSNAGTIRTLTNTGAIKGGGAFGPPSLNGTGGAGVSNSGMIGSLNNSGGIAGGADGGVPSGAGGAGVSNAGTITRLTNSGSIAGGAGHAFSDTASGGAGVVNSSRGVITSLTNQRTGTIFGGGTSGYGSGGAGIYNAGTIGTITNRGKISGAGAGSFFGNGNGAAGDAIYNAGRGASIGTITNRGTISGAGADAFFGSGAAGDAIYSAGSGASIGTIVNSGAITGGPNYGNGAAGDAIYSAGAGASIGTISNTGSIVGNVEIDNQSSVTIMNETRKRGSWTGGTINIGDGNLTFGGGAVLTRSFLGDDITVDGGAGTVFNKGRLQLASPIAITGNYDQTAAARLGLDVAGDAWGDYGALSVTGMASLDGRLAIDLTNGFALKAGDTFDDIVTSGGALSGDFSRLWVDGSPCSAKSSDVWLCSNVGFYLDLTVVRSLVSGAPGSVDLSVAGIPEPATWTLLGIGFLGLGGFGLRRRGASRRRDIADL